MSAHPDNFPRKVHTVGGLPLMLEVIPPRRDADADKVSAWRDRIIAATRDVAITALNIPEVRDESREGERTYTYVKRMKPREFGALLQAAPSEDFDIVINRVVAHRPMEQQRQWLDNCYREWGIRNVILVGGESSRVTYPGPSVSSTARFISQELNPLLPAEGRWCCGGICIPSRRRSDPEQDEPMRLFKKGAAGIDFFTTQIIYEADTMCRLLSDYAALCEREGVMPRRIFITMAPIQSSRNIEFLRWLGVDVPLGIEAELTQGTGSNGSASVKVGLRVAKQVIDYNQQLAVSVPLGFNVSPLMRSNFDLSIDLLRGLSQLETGG